MRWQLTVLGILLCLLAALFAVEAKLAWFGPEGSPTAQISSAKLQPADAPKALAQSHVPSIPFALFRQFAAILVLLSITCPLVLIATPVRASIDPGSPGFFSSLFFRPPPGC